MAALYYAELVNFFARSLGDRDAAADVVQESYARVLAMSATSSVVRDLRALLFHTGKNIVVDGARRRRAEAHMLQTLALLCADEAPSAEREVSARHIAPALGRSKPGCAADGSAATAPGARPASSSCGARRGAL